MSKFLLLQYFIDVLVFALIPYIFSLPTVTNEEDDQLLEKEKPIQVPDPIPDVTPISKIVNKFYTLIKEY